MSNRTIAPDATKFKVIQTFHNGFHFRSRLEARWGIYLETMGIDYLYEYEGFALDSAGWYLPDLYLPDFEMWAEIKPTAFNPQELAKLKALVTFTQKPALMLIGVPGRKAYEAWCIDTQCRPSGLYLTNFALSNFYQKQRRFYGDLYDGEILNPCFDDINAGVLAARSARF